MVYYSPHYYELLNLRFKIKSSRSLSLNVIIDIESIEEVISVREYLNNPIYKSLVRIGDEKNGVRNEEALIEELNLYKNLRIILFFLLEDKYIGDDKRYLYRYIA